jgi:hypothetical protein
MVVMENGSQGSQGKICSVCIHEQKNLLWPYLKTKYLSWLHKKKGLILTTFIKKYFSLEVAYVHTSECLG